MEDFDLYREPAPLPENIQPEPAEVRPVSPLDGKGLTIWRAIYPILIFLAVDFTIQVIDIYRYLIASILTGESILLGANTGEDVLELLVLLPQRIIDLLTKDALILMGIRCVILIPVFAVMMHHDRKRAIAKGLPMPMASWETLALDPLRIALTFVLAVAAFFGFNLLLSLSRIDEIDPIYQATSEMTFSEGGLIMFLTAGLIGPVCEEYLFRGIVYRRLRNRFRPVFCILVSSIIFGLIHGNLVQFVYASLIGCILAWVYENTKNLLLPMLIHIVANCISCTLTTLNVYAGFKLELPFIAIIAIIVTSIAYIVFYFIYFHRKSAVRY